VHLPGQVVLLEGWSCLALPRPVPGAQPYLGARSVLPGSGDMMRDGVPRWGVAAAHSLEAAQGWAWQQAGGGSRPQVHR
jgi:hypothetical protein